MNILDKTPPQADHRLPYGSLPLQFGDLWLPQVAHGVKAPLLVFVHGGWWQSQYTLDYAGFVCAALKRAGVAVWSIEYRRVGDTGGGWPGTFQDVAAGFDFITTLAKAYPIDLNHVAATGHSAGGHLAFWLAGRHHIPADSVLRSPQPTVPLRGVVALAGAVDLRLTLDLGGFFEFASGKPSTRSLMGGLPKEEPERYRAGDPGELLPLGVPQWLVQGSADDQIPPQLPLRYADNARRQGDHVSVEIVPAADHFDVVDPESKAWPVVQKSLLAALRG